jgi:GTP cyclohydrolase I
MSIESALPDVQSESKHPARPEVLAGIDRVKIRIVLPDQRQIPATLSVVARVPRGSRGVHMSRLYRNLAPDGQALRLTDLSERTLEVARSQETSQLEVSLAWEDLLERTAPMTGSAGFHPYRVQMRASWDPTGGVRLRTRLESAAMLACPCSKALSGDLGFHNQRGILQAEVEGDQSSRLGSLVEILDQAASNRVHPVLRREDEKEVIDVLSRTDSFRFVEDAASRLLDLLEAAGHPAPSVHVRSLESIHAHDAVAWAGERGRELSEGVPVR